MRLQVEPIRSQKNVVGCLFIRFTDDSEYSLVVVNQQSLEVCAVGENSLDVLYEMEIQEPVAAATSISVDDRQWVVLLTKLNRLFFVAFNGKFIIAECLDLVVPQMSLSEKVDLDRGVCTVMDVKPFLESSGDLLAVYSSSGVLQVYLLDDSKRPLFKRALEGRPYTGEKRLERDKLIGKPLIVPLDFPTVTDLVFAAPHTIAITSRDQNLRRQVSYVQVDNGVVRRHHTFYPPLESLPHKMVPCSGGVALFCERECVLFPQNTGMPYSQTSVPQDCEIEGYTCTKRISIQVTAHATLDDTHTVLVDIEGKVYMMDLEAVQGRVYNWEIDEIGQLQQPIECLAHISGPLFFGSSFHYGTSVIRFGSKIEETPIAAHNGSAVAFAGFEGGYVLSEGNRRNHTLSLVGDDTIELDTEGLAVRLEATATHVVALCVGEKRCIAVYALDGKQVARIETDCVIRDFAVDTHITVYAQDVMQQYRGELLRYTLSGMLVARATVENATFSRVVTYDNGYVAFGDGMCYFDDELKLLQSGIANGYINSATRISDGTWAVTDTERGVRLTGFSPQGKIVSKSTSILANWPLTGACTLQDEILLVGDALGNVFLVDMVPGDKVALTAFSHAHLGDAINFVQNNNGTVVVGTSNGELFSLSLLEEGDDPADSPECIVPLPKNVIHVTFLPMSDVSITSFPVAARSEKFS